MAKYRIVSLRWWTAFDEPVTTPAVQKRVGFFWWVTLTRCESVKQAFTYIRNVEKKKPDKVLGVIVK